MTSNPDVPLFIGYVEMTASALRLIHAARHGVSIKFESLKSLISKRLSKPALFTSIHSYASASHSYHPPTRDHRTRQYLPGSSSHTPLPIGNGSNGLPPGPTSDMAGTDRSKPLPPPSPADTTGKSRTHTVLQGTISALKLIQQIVGLAPVPGLPSLVGVVLNISEVVNNNYAAEDALVELAQKAGSFMVTLVSLVEQGSASTFSDPDSMNSVIEGLTKEMNRVLGVVNRISSQRLPTRFLLSASDKATVDECNRQMVLACGIFGIRIAFIAQKAIARIEAKLNQALEILQELNQQTTTPRRASTC